MCVLCYILFFFFKQKTAYEMRISDWSSYVCSSDLWLRQFEVGANSAAANRLMDRLEYLQRFDLPADLLDGVPAHRVTRLRRQGERYYADGMRDLPEDRRLAILAVCTLEWRSSLADVIVET